MNIIIPMAGMGKRMRPHSLTVPKPLIPVAGKPIVQRVVENIAEVSSEKIEEVAFVIGDFGSKTEQKLLAIAEKVNATGKIYYQKEALGTAHAILCAKQALKGKTIVAFADTLCFASFKLKKDQLSTIWVQQVEDPRPYGVVKLDANNQITDFIEKPQEFVSDKAIIGIYYFADGEMLHDELQFLIDNNIKDKGEFQLTNALENMKQKGVKFTIGQVDEWLDCGNKNATVYANQRILEREHKKENTIAKNVKTTNSLIVPPCYIEENVELNNSVVGPHVSIGKGTVIANSCIQNTIVQKHAEIKNSVINNSMLGNHSKVNGKTKNFSIGDYSVQE